MRFVLTGCRSVKSVLYGREVAEILPQSATYTQPFAAICIVAYFLDFFNWIFIDYLNENLSTLKFPAN